MSVPVPAASGYPGLIAAGARFLPVKKLLIARGYYFDIEMLFGVLYKLVRLVFPR